MKTNCCPAPSVGEPISRLEERKEGNDNGT